jgi:carbon-monoxide dehydrogenase iron sulfur subunit
LKASKGGEMTAQDVMSSNKMIVINAERCTGCRLCELACSYNKVAAFKPYASRIKVNLLSKEGMSVPLICIHCTKCHCMDVCEPDAIYKNSETGAMEIDIAKCNGCKACLTACPYGAMHFDRVTEKTFVCDLCKGDPECVKYCFVKAIEYIDIDSVPFVRARDHIEGIRKSILEESKEVAK